MIPFILGGVALAATGYGVAKLLEDNCSEERSESFYEDYNDENYEKLEDEVIKKYELIQRELHNTTLIELKTALGEIDYSTASIFTSVSNLDKRIYRFETLTDEIKQSFENYAQILKRTKEYVNSNSDRLDSIIIDENNYERYSDENKIFIDTLINLCNLVDKVAQSQMTNDEVNISREIKRSFKKLEIIIK